MDENKSKVNPPDKSDTLDFRGGFNVRAPQTQSIAPLPPPSNPNNVQLPTAIITQPNQPLPFYHTNDSYPQSPPSKILARPRQENSQQIHQRSNRQHQFPHPLYHHQRNPQQVIQQRNPQQTFQQRNPQQAFQQRNPQQVIPLGNPQQRNPQQTFQQRNPQQTFQQRNPQQAFQQRNLQQPFPPQNPATNHHVPRHPQPLPNYHQNVQPRSIRQSAGHQLNNINPRSQPYLRENNSQDERNDRMGYQALVDNILPKRTSSKFMNMFYEMVVKPKEVKRSTLAESYRKLSLQDQLEVFLNTLSLDERGEQSRLILVEDLRVILKREFPNCLIYPFGSFLTGVGDLSSDIDIFVDIFGLTNGFTQKVESTSKDLMKRCHLILRRAECPRTGRKFAHGFITIGEARVPILKLTHNLTNVNCDLSFENLISVRNSEMIAFFMKLHPVVKPLIILIRYWGKFHELTGSNSVKNYALNLLVLVFLADKKVIPTIAKLQRMENVQKRQKKIHFEIDGWDTSFCEDVNKVLSKFKPSLSPEKASQNLVGTVGSLAAEFFEMYAKIDFTTKAVCTYTAEFLEKSLFFAGNEEELPILLDRYKEWSAKAPTNRRLNINTPLCIQDPFVLSFNVGSVCPSGILMKFQVACAQTTEILKCKESFNSLLDAFNPLPLEVGEKRFLTLQQKHQQTLDLIEEISSFCWFHKKPNVLPQKKEESVPLHLRPIEEIISKSTIKLGKGWQSYQSFQPDQQFRELFLHGVVQFKLTQKFTNPNLFQKLRKLWIDFVQDFISKFWSKVFGFHVDYSEHIEELRYFSDSPMRCRSKRPHEILFSEKEVRKATNRTNQTPKISPQKIVQMNKKLNELGPINEKIIFMKTLCTSYEPVWEKRDQTLKNLYPTLRSTESIVSEDTPSSSMKEKPSSRKKEKRQQSKAKLLMKMDPLEIEKEITKTILKKKINKSAKPMLAFFSYVKLDYSIVDDFPTIYFVYDKDVSTKDSTYVQAVSTINDIITTLLPQYLCFRLKEWMEYEEASDETVSDPDSPRKAEDQQNTGENIMEQSVGQIDDESMLMPPSDESDED